MELWWPNCGNGLKRAEPSFASPLRRCLVAVGKRPRTRTRTLATEVVGAAEWAEHRIEWPRERRDRDRETLSFGDGEEMVRALGLADDDCKHCGDSGV